MRMNDFNEYCTYSIKEFLLVLFVLFYVSYIEQNAAALCEPVR